MRRRDVLVLGIGNLLLGDEGVGVHAVRAMQGIELPRGVDVLDGGTGGLQLLGCFDDYRCIVMIDATLDGRAPGTVAVTRPRFAHDFPRALSAHDIGLRDMLETAALLGPWPKMFLVTVSIAARQSPGVELSSPVSAAIERVIARTQAILRQEAFCQETAAGSCQVAGVADICRRGVPADASTMPE